MRRQRFSLKTINPQKVGPAPTPSKRRATHNMKAFSESEKSNSPQVNTTSPHISTFNGPLSSHIFPQNGCDIV